MEQMDYLIVGAGLTGATLARELTDAGKQCLVIDKRNHIGGNVFTQRIDGIDVHTYGRISFIPAMTPCGSMYTALCA